MFRIVMEKVGDIPVGYRVQREVWNQHSQESDWTRKGRRYMTLQGARDFRKYLEDIEQYRYGNTYEVVE